MRKNQNNDESFRSACLRADDDELNQLFVREQNKGNGSLAAIADQVRESRGIYFSES